MMTLREIAECEARANAEFYLTHGESSALCATARRAIELLKRWDNCYWYESEIPNPYDIDNETHDFLAGVTKEPHIEDCAIISREALQAAIEKYIPWIQHKPSCASVLRPAIYSSVPGISRAADPCDCGLDEFLKDA